MHPASAAIPAFLSWRWLFPRLSDPFRGPKKTTRFAVIDYSVRAAERKLVNPKFGPATKKQPLLGAPAKLPRAKRLFHSGSSALPPQLLSHVEALDLEREDSLAIKARKALPGSMRRLHFFPSWNWEGGSYAKMDNLSRSIRRSKYDPEPRCPSGR